MANKLTKIAKQASEHRWKTVKGGDWKALDARTKTGRGLRISQVGTDEDEPVEVFLFTDAKSGILEANASFSNGVPLSTIVTFIKDMLKI